MRDEIYFIACVCSKSKIITKQFTVIVIIIIQSDLVVIHIHKKKAIQNKKEICAAAVELFILFIIHEIERLNKKKEFLSYFLLFIFGFFVSFSHKFIKFITISYLYVCVCVL